MTERAYVPIRDSCLDCALKHIAQARALMLETCKGYPEHVQFARGHLAEAEDETSSSHVEVTEWIRQLRGKIEDTKFHTEIPELMTLFRHVTRRLCDYDAALTEEQLNDRGYPTA